MSRKIPGPTQEERRAIFHRDNWACRRCGRAGTTYPLTIHHRRPRSMGGTRSVAINGPSNLVTLCGSGTEGCHGWVESNRKIAYALGWLVPSWADPEEWPIRFAEGHWAQPKGHWWERLTTGTEWQTAELETIETAGGRRHG